MGKLGFLGCTINEYDLPGVSSVAYGKLILSDLKDLKMFFHT